MFFYFLSIKRSVKIEWMSLCNCPPGLLYAERLLNYKEVFVLNANDLSTLRIQCFLQGCCMQAPERGNATNPIFWFLSLKSWAAQSFVCFLGGGCLFGFLFFDPCAPSGCRLEKLMLWEQPDKKQ